MKRPVASAASHNDDESVNPWTHVEPDGSNLTVAAFPTTMIVTLGNALRRTVTVPYAEAAGLSVPEWRLLSLMAHYSPVSFSAIVGYSGSDKALVSRTMRLLEERGLIEVRPDAAGSKKKLDCVITRAGRALNKKVIRVAQERQAKVLQALTEE
jgi:DNA-binding MarR family transcriptional regulator